MLALRICFSWMFQLDLMTVYVSSIPPNPQTLINLSYPSSLKPKLEKSVETTPWQALTIRFTRVPTHVLLDFNLSPPDIASDRSKK